MDLIHVGLQAHAGKHGVHGLALGQGGGRHQLAGWQGHLQINSIRLEGMQQVSGSPLL